MPSPIVRYFLPLSAFLSLIVAGCAKEPAPPAAPEVLSAQLAKGTKISAMLVKPLESGVDDEGVAVPFVVMEDVKDDAGHVLIPQGSPLTGKVGWSRKAGAIDGLLNRPARLKVEFEEVTTVDGQKVEVCADPDEPNELYEFNRSNTKREEVEKQLESLSHNAQNSQVLGAISDLFDKGDSRVLDSEESRVQLAELGKQLHIPDLQSIDQSGEADKVKALLEGFRNGQTLSQLSPGGQSGQMALLALTELANLAGSVGNTLGRLTHGRNIKAYVGTPVTAYVKSSQSISVRPAR